MKGLNEKESAAAWQAVQEPSFAGIAAINEEYIFIHSNSQFHDIAGVSAAEVWGKSLLDMVPVSMRKTVIENVSLVREGKVSSYLTPLHLSFPSGHSVQVLLLINGAYCLTSDIFLFFIGTVMQDKSEEQDIATVAPPPKQASLWDYVDVKKVGMAILTAFGLGIAYLIERAVKHLG